MAETFQIMRGSPEPLISRDKRMRLADDLFTRAAEIHAGDRKTAEMLRVAAGEMRHMMFCIDHYRDRWVRAEWIQHDRNTSRDEAQEKNDGKRDE